MEAQRGRSTSSGGSPHQVRHGTSPSPNSHFANASPVNSNPNSLAAGASVGGLGFDLQQATASFSTSNTDFSQNLNSSSNSQASFNNSFDFSTDPQQQNFFSDQSLGGTVSGTGSGAANANNFDNRQGNHINSNSNNNSNPAGFQDFVAFDTSSGLGDSFDQPLFANNNANNPANLNSGEAASRMFDNSGLVDPILLESNTPQHTPPMATHTQSATPPHLLAPTMQRQSSGSPHTSPALAQGAFQSSPGRARNGSLDPSAAYTAHVPNTNTEWTLSNPAAFRSHRRNHSDALSDVSSNHPSPYLPSHDAFDQPEPSPLLGPADPGMFQDVMGLGQVSLNEAVGSPYISPVPSPGPSPRLGPSTVLAPPDNFGLLQGLSPPPMKTQFDVVQHGIYGLGPNQEPFPTLNQPIPSVEIGQADAMTPPEINIQLAPPSRTSSFDPPDNSGIEGALSPPERSARLRAKSDPFSSRSSTPSRDTLSPHAAGVGSRSPSPSGKGRRSSTSSVPNRDYILDLADPNRPNSQSSDNGGQSKRTQKHPATFQCSLCPKRFTRAYNLRSHLRTHTDERPFVCSVCGKAFARQHDRKRHEGLHSGEKKFVCKGSLKDGNNWGCGRRFARADALGRHFRSEAGRVCIKPLMDEESLERMHNQNAELGGGMQMIPGMLPGQQVMAGQPGFDAYGVNAANQNYSAGMAMGGGLQMRLPQALLQQYPTLGGIWDQLPSNGPEEIEGDISGRSSFDASSAGEYDDEDYGPPGGAYGWASDVGP